MTSKGETVTCRNQNQKRRTHKNGTRWTECRGCPFVYTYLSSKGPSGDIVQCDSPMPIKYGDEVEVRRVGEAAEAAGDES